MIRPWIDWRWLHDTRRAAVQGASIGAGGRVRGRELLCCTWSGAVVYAAYGRGTGRARLLAGDEWCHVVRVSPKYYVVGRVFCVPYLAGRCG